METSLWPSKIFKKNSRSCTPSHDDVSAFLKMWNKMGGWKENMFEPPPICSGGKNYANVLRLKNHNVCNPQKPRITKGRISHNHPSFHCPEWPPIYYTYNPRECFPTVKCGLIPSLLGDHHKVLQGSLHHQLKQCTITMENAPNLTYLCILWSHQHGSHWMTPSFLVPCVLSVGDVIIGISGTGISTACMPASTPNLKAHDLAK